MRLTFVLTVDAGSPLVLVESPDLPGFHTHGATLDEALEMAAALLQELKAIDAALWLGDYAAYVSDGLRVEATLDGATVPVVVRRRA